MEIKIEILHAFLRGIIASKEIELENFREKMRKKQRLMN